MINVQKQHELELFVEREVMLGQTSLINELLQNNVFSPDDIENLEYTEQELLDQGYTTTEIENGEAQVDKEIYEWWLVSSWLLAKLRDKGETILSNEYGEWWGRGCIGQGIALDAVIEDIYDEFMAS